MTQPDFKIDALKNLGSLRKRNCYFGYYPISYFHHGGYESEFVSPYTNTAGNENSWIMILLQDWSSFDSLSKAFDKEKARLGYTPNLPTNRNLVKLLKSVFDLSIEDVFVTNVFPFVKKGGMSAKIPQQDFNRSFKEFCFPQINIVNPKMVICCGKQVYEACLSNFNKPFKKNYLIGENFMDNDIRYYHQRHTGATATNTNGGIETAIINWIKMREHFKNNK